MESNELLLLEKKVQLLTHAFVLKVLYFSPISIHILMRTNLTVIYVLNVKIFVFFCLIQHKLCLNSLFLLTLVTLSYVNFWLNTYFILGHTHMTYIHMLHKERILGLIASYF